MRHRDIALLIVATALLAPLGGAAFADCQVISATYGGHWQGEALSMSQALAARSANALKAQKKWRGITVKAQAVKPDPFFKTVRPEVSTNLIVGTYVTARTYTTCWTGVTVPFVCTSGSQVCRK
jgi:hypothetical protein